MRWTKLAKEEKINQHIETAKRMIEKYKKDLEILKDK